MPNSQSLSPAPLSIGHFQILKVLDQGLSSILYLAQDVPSQALVTLKTAPPGTVTPGLLERYERALEAAHRLAHPGVHQIHELGRDRAFGPYLVMDYLEGTSLAPLVAGGLPAFPALHLLVQIVHVLEFAARAGILHGDVQPSNIWVTPQGQAKLQGFCALGWMPPGSEGYCAPERLEGGAPTPRADQFSLAATAFHLLSGKQPFLGASQEEVLRAVQNGEVSLPSKMSSMMQKVFLKALDKDPKGRYVSFRDFMAVLIAAAPLEEHRLEDLLTFLDGFPLAFEDLECLSQPQAARPEPIPNREAPPIPVVLPPANLEVIEPLEARLEQNPGVSGFATFDAHGTLLAASSQAGDLVDLAPSVYFSLADAAFGGESGSQVRHFVFRTGHGIRYLLHRRASALIVIKLKPEANLQEILQGLSTDQGQN